jgi:uncharacterized membrane protein YeaQ/YmgE (transglycosylase-associated protein family)
VPDAAELGAVLFGVVVGWVTYRTLIRRSDEATLSDIATVIGAVGGGAVVGLFDSPHLFGLYSIGLAVGFFGYLALFRIINGSRETGDRMGRDDKTTAL